MKNTLKIRLKAIGKLKFWVLLVLAFCVFLPFFVVFYDKYVTNFSSEFIYDDISKIPYNKCALLLGTTKILPDGRRNLFYLYRIDAVSALYKAGKVSCIVASGDNSTKKNNEPESMRIDLIAKGIPEKNIYLDYAGFDTLDSIVRMNKIFGQSAFTIVSQKFHNERALYIAKKMGYEASGFSAKDVPNFFTARMEFREKFARMKMFYELLLDASPKFLGEEIEIE
ncbi:MAG: ElyC/SanA/YdcF family protein [Candidatus Gracilibacteria bacterium]|nr:ElyC/SanA/YdcF family protein [Candidatus Gracilibacteria bacterium]